MESRTKEDVDGGPRCNEVRGFNIDPDGVTTCSANCNKWKLGDPGNWTMECRTEGGNNGDISVRFWVEPEI